MGNRTPCFKEARQTCNSLGIQSPFQSMWTQPSFFGATTNLRRFQGIDKAAKMSPMKVYSSPYFAWVSRRHDPWPMLRRMKHCKCMVKLCSVFGFVTTPAVSGIYKRRQKTSQLLHDGLCDECPFLSLGGVFFFLNYAFAQAQFFCCKQTWGANYIQNANCVTSWKRRFLPSDSLITQMDVT